MSRECPAYQDVICTAFDEKEGAISKSAPASGSAYVLVKENMDDGRLSMHEFSSEEELRTHLFCMWRYTDYKLISVARKQ